MGGHFRNQHVAKGEAEFREPKTELANGGGKRDNIGLLTGCREQTGQRSHRDVVLL